MPFTEETPLDLITLGWNGQLSNLFSSIAADGEIPGRVTEAQRDLCTVACDAGELLAEVSGRFRLLAGSRADFPAVGDWVAIAPRPAEGRATIRAILPRSTTFVRKTALSAADAREKAEEQVVAANIDIALIVMGLDHDFNVRRLERYLTLAWGCGTQPVVVLNKADLCDQLPERLAETEAVAVGVPVLMTSAQDGSGVQALLAHLPRGKTAALLGSSGVGKSTLTNRLLGVEAMATGAVRDDDQRGRHTTTHREMVLLPNGALLVDNPGMRQVGLWGDEEDVNDAFSDVAALAASCRFSDCRHGAEPGCAVRAALGDGSLDSARYESWRKLQRELAFLARRDDVRAQAAQKQMLKNRARSMRGFQKGHR